MEAIINGWLPEVRGWHTTVSDQFMLQSDGAIGFGKALPAVMEFPITFDGVWTEEFGTYFTTPVGGIYQRGTSQPDAQPVPPGYRAYVNKVSVEVGWVYVGTLLQPPWDPGDTTRWFWKRKRVGEAAHSVVPGAAGRPCMSRTLYGAPSVYAVGEYYTATGVSGPQMIRVPFTAGTGTPFIAGQIAVFAGGGTGIVEQSITTTGGAGAQVGSIWLKAGTVTNFAGLTGAISQLPTAGPVATAGAAVIAEPPALNPTSYQQLYFYPQAVMPPIFLEPGDLNVLRIENYTSNASQSLAISISASGVMWPIGLEAA